MNYPKDYLLIFFSALLAFIRSIRNDFVFDDQEAIIKNRDLKNLDDIFSLNVFEHDFWGTDIDADSSHKSYRPFTVIIYRLIAKFIAIDNQTSLSSSKSLDPFPFHCINVLAYCFCCCYLYLIIKNWLRSRLICHGEFRQLALKITLFFTIHPLHCEPVFI